MTATQEAPATVRRASRSSRDPVLGGVAGGLAVHLEVPVIAVRAAFVLLTALGGLGIALYAGLWMVLPTDATFGEESPGLASARRSGRRPSSVRRMTDLGPIVTLGVLGLGVVFAAEAVLGRGAVFWPVALGLAGVALLWRQADEAQRERWLDSSGSIDPIRAVFGRGGWAAYARVIAGAVLILTGLVFFALQDGDFGPARQIVLAGLLGIAGLAMTVGPWIFRLAADLTSERAERIRSQERADLAAHLHDSVLQTLALIQKNAADAATVARLARSQERDLRSWLYAGDDAGAQTVAGALRAAAAEIEDAHGIVADVVAVGDRPQCEATRPVVLAAREAMVNAAKHAGTARVDVYAEVGSDLLEVFVRDRGSGFDPARIAEDRHGVRGSIIDRMVRHGGSAEVRSAPGEGTEVRLHMPLPTTDEGEG